MVAVLGCARGKTAHLRVSVRPNKKGEKKLLFDLDKYNFGQKLGVTQIIASTSHLGQHLAFNQEGRVMSVYDYTTTSFCKDDRPKTSTYFPEKINYQSGRDQLLSVLSWPEHDDEVIHIVKETDPGVWLVHLGVRKTFALYNLLTGGLVLCKLPGLEPHSLTMVTFRMHPNFFLGNN